MEVVTFLGIAVVMIGIVVVIPSRKIAICIGYLACLALLAIGLWG